MVLFLAVHEGASRGARSVATKLLSKDEARRIDACLSVPAHPKVQNVAEHGRSSSVLRSKGPEARRPKGNDDAQDHCVGSCAGGYRDHAQGQARHATGAAASRSGNRDHASAKAPERSDPVLNAADSANIAK